MFLIKHKRLLRKYRKLYQIVNPTITKDDHQQFELAFKMISDTYAKQDTKSIHKALRAIDMAKIVAKDLGLGMTAICCAILYSIIDHPDRNAIQNQFGTLVAQIMEHLYQVKGFPQPEKAAQKAFLKQLLSSSRKYPRVMLIKIAESVHNMHSLNKFTQEYQQAVINAATKLYAPLSHRLGFHAIKTTLEDLSLKHKNPQVYQQLHEQIEHTRKVTQGFFQRFLRPLKGRLKQGS